MKFEKQDKLILRYIGLFEVLEQVKDVAYRLEQILEDLLRSCVLHFSSLWDEHLLLAEFSYNNSYQASINMTPFEVLYSRPYRYPTCWLEDK